MLTAQSGSIPWTMRHTRHSNMWLNIRRFILKGGTHMPVLSTDKRQYQYVLVTGTCITGPGNREPSKHIRTMCFNVIKLYSTPNSALMFSVWLCFPASKKPEFLFIIYNSLWINPEKTIAILFTRRPHGRQPEFRSFDHSIPWPRTMKNLELIFGWKLLRTE